MTRAGLLLAAVLVALATGSRAGLAGAPEVLELLALDGSPVRLERPRGDEALVVHFWATWCPSCVAELRTLDAAVRRCRAGPRVLAVNVAEDPDAIRRFLASLPLAPDSELVQLRDPSGDLWRRLSGRSLPLNLLWTRDEARVEPGPKDAAAWARVLESAGCGPGRPPRAARETRLRGSPSGTAPAAIPSPRPG